MYHPLLESETEWPEVERVNFFTCQRNQTIQAMKELSAKGCSQASLQPYLNHLKFLNDTIDPKWEIFKTSVANDIIRTNLCDSINWMPLIGCRYQEMISSHEFRQRWNT